MDNLTLTSFINFLTNHWYVVALIIFLIVTSIPSESPTVSPSQANDLVFSKNGILIDTRSREEFLKKNIEGSINLNLEGFQKYILTTKKTVITIHEKDSDAKEYQAIFKKLKSNKKLKHNIFCYYLENGISAWEKKNYPLNINNKRRNKNDR